MSVLTVTGEQYLKKNPSVTLSTTNPIYTDLCSKRSLRVEGQATSRVKHNTDTNKKDPYAWLHSIFVFTKSHFWAVF
jgi:hypothetical protein